MAEIIATPDCAASTANRFKEAVCIQAGRIFDSCSDKDCLEDLQVYFTPESQDIIDRSAIVKCKAAEVLDVYLSVEPIPFNKGFFTVDMTFYFRVHFTAYASQVSTPVNVRGLCFHTKKVILFGGEGNVKTFRSDEEAITLEQSCNASMPTATAKVVDPITLGSRLVDCVPAYSEPIGSVPTGICEFFDGDLILVPCPESKTALVTLGVFTIVTLERNVQLMIPAYDYVLPEKDCATSFPSEDPCEMFKKIKFPIQEFFPDNINENGCGGVTATDATIVTDVE